MKKQAHREKQKNVEKIGCYVEKKPIVWAIKNNKYRKNRLL